MPYIVVNCQGRYVGGDARSAVAAAEHRDGIDRARDNAARSGHLTVFHRQTHLHVIGNYPFPSNGQIEAVINLISTSACRKVLFELRCQQRWVTAIYPKQQAVVLLRTLALEPGFGRAARTPERVVYDAETYYGDCLPDLG